MEDLVHQSFLFKIYLALFSIGCSEVTIKGQLTLSPMSVAPVCRVGDPLQLTCTASVESGIQWSVFRHNEQVFSDVLITIGSANNQRTTVTVDSTTITFIRTSAQGASPLTSALSIDSVSIGLNGTVVNCGDLSDPTTSAATTIQTIDTSQNFLLYTPTLRVSDERYDADNVTVTVEWTPQEGVTYTTSVSPLTSITVTGSSSRQLTISYNTDYNLSVEAAPPCRPNPTSIIALKYAKCNNPEMLFTFDMYNDAVPRVEDYDDMAPILEGHILSFTCPPGFMLTGPDSATCAESGEWEPDPRGFMCSNMSSQDGVQESCCKSKCSLAAAVSSSVLTFIATSIAIFIAGFVIGRYFRLSKGKLHITTDQPHQGPVYDYVQPSTAKPQENLELTVNVAYHPSKSITVEH